MKRSQREVAVSTAAVLAAISVQAGAITNGGFETGDFTGWVLTPNVSLFSGVDPFAARSGSFGAFFGPPRDVGGISQSFATTPNQTYRVDFDLSLTGSVPPASFSWSWNGVNQSPSFDNSAAFGYTRFSSFVSATDTSSTLAFDFRNGQSFWLLDNVAVSVAPETPISALLAAGLVIVAPFVRRATALRRKQNARAESAAPSLDPIAVQR